MKKQITYSKIVPRLFAVTLDLSVMSFFLVPVMTRLSHFILKLTYQDYFISAGINMSDQNAMAKAIMSQEFMSQIALVNNLPSFVLILLLDMLFFGLYFVTLWVKYGTTPGKFILGLRVADSETLEKPSFKSALKRFLIYPTGLFGIFLSFFSKSRQAPHDKFAGTVVIKA
jgi:uncharacterized RDD family membrane protein YckC